MRTRRMKVCALVLCGLAVSVGGCFGENILTATAKVIGGQMSTLTPDEIRLLNEAAIALFGSQDPNFEAVPLTQAQAQAISNFLALNNINTVEDVEAIIRLARTNPEQILGLEELAAAFAGTDVDELDPDNLNPDDLNEVFQSILGGVGGA